jgi:UDP-N-acetyl-D-mannosaminuronic acid dehydrogenase
MVKLTENAFRDVNIAFANELSMICAELELDAWKVIEFANRHPRVNILNPGPGVGGHCIAVDPWFIVSSAPGASQLIRTSREVNEAKKRHVVDQVSAIMARHPDAKVACLGLTYKPDVDDFRESPAFDIAVALSNSHPGRVHCSDPFADAMPTSLRERGQLLLVSTDRALDEAELIVLLVGHSAFRGFPRPDGKVIVDTVGFWR